MGSDWDRPGFVEGFCEALAKRVAELEAMCFPYFKPNADMQNFSLKPGEIVMARDIERWKRIEQAARDYLLAKQGSHARLRDALES